MNAKRHLITFLEKTLRVKIARPEKVALLFEELHLKRFFEHFQVDCVFDVGANAGQYADMLRDRVGFKGPIISFEPNHAMADQLRQKMKKDPNWHFEPVALSAAVGEATFNIMDGSEFSSLLQPQRNEYDSAHTEQNKVMRKETVKTSTLKIEYQKYKQKLGFSRPFLKMDTQGNDVIVVKSAEKMIDSFVGLQSELAIKRLYTGAPYFQEAIAFYQSKGFELSAFVPNNEGHFPYLVETDCIMFRSGAKET